MNITTPKKIKEQNTINLVLLVIAVALIVITIIR